MRIKAVPGHLPQTRIMDFQPVMPFVTIVAGAPIPVFGEGLGLRLPRALSGPDSVLGPAAPTGATRYGNHTAFVQSISRPPTAIVLQVLPAPSYSYLGGGGLSPATWLLRHPPSFRDRHLPLPYEPPNTPHPPTPAHPEFGAPLDPNGWRDRRPSRNDIDAMEVELRFTARVCVTST